MCLAAVPMRRRKEKARKTAQGAVAVVGALVLLAAETVPASRHAYDPERPWKGRGPSEPERSIFYCTTVR